MFPGLIGSKSSTNASSRCFSKKKRPAAPRAISIRSSAARPRKNPKKVNRREAVPPRAPRAIARLQVYTKGPPPNRHQQRPANAGQDHLNDCRSKKGQETAL